jgi:hypothetical protein
MWKKGTGEEEPTTRVPSRSFAITPLIVHSAFALEDIRISSFKVGEHLEI